MSYRAPRWLPGAHLQTIYPALFLKRSPPRLRREIWTSPDHDIIAVDFLDSANVSAPLLVLFHGLEGSSASHYAIAQLRHLKKIGWAAAVVHFRGCGGLNNQKPRAYHAGDSAEIDWVLRRMQTDHPQHPLLAFGVSLGGNALLKWLGEQGSAAQSILRGVVAVSVPFDLTATGKHLDQGLNRWFYTRHFLSTLKQKAKRLLPDNTQVQLTKTLRDFDDRFTARIHGFRDVDDYWLRSSSRPWLKTIVVKTLLIQAQNDPFLPTESLPKPEELSENISLCWPEQGGHAGFVSGPFPGQMNWLPETSCKWLASCL